MNSRVFCFFIFMVKIKTFHPDNFTRICNTLAREHAVFTGIKKAYGHPPVWQRPPGFETLVRLILEQQVSLASAQSAYLKLLAHRTVITPENMVQMPANDWKPCFVSRQKARYITALSEAVLSGKILLDQLAVLPDEEVKAQLEKLPGIGNWTSDVYLIMCLNRTDIFPIGDVALRTSIKETLNLPADFAPEKLVSLADDWRPYRSIATYFFWHRYLKIRKRGTHY